MRILERKFKIVKSEEEEHYQSGNCDNKVQDFLVSAILWSFYWETLNTKQSANCFKNARRVRFCVYHTIYREKEKKREDVIKHLELFRLVVERKLRVGDLVVSNSSNIFRGE